MSSVPSCGRKNEVSEVKGSSERKKTWGRGAQIPLAIGQKKGGGGNHYVEQQNNSKKKLAGSFSHSQNGGVHTFCLTSPLFRPK